MTYFQANTVDAMTRTKSADTLPVIACQTGPTKRRPVSAQCVLYRKSAIKTLRHSANIQANRSHGRMGRKLEHLHGGRFDGRFGPWLSVAIVGPRDAVVVFELAQQ